MGEPTLVIATPEIRLHASGDLERLSSTGEHWIPIGWEPQLANAVAATLAARDELVRELGEELHERETVCDMWRSSVSEGIEERDRLRASIATLERELAELRPKADEVLRAHRKSLGWSLRGFADAGGNVSGRDPRVEPRAVVLLSGGMDSTAALHWTKDRYGEVRAIGFDYGQPNGLLELSAARRVAAKLATPFESINLGWGVFHGQGLCAGVADHHATPAVNAAFVPGRNMLFLTLAAGRGSVWWPAGDFAVVIGANADDASGFPDCREEFFEAAGTALRRGIQRSVEIVTPFVDMTKGEILRWCSPAALDDVRRSWSCYRKAAEPCGACTACVVRAKAFADAGMEEEDRWS